MTLPGLARSKVAAVTDVSVAPTHRRRGLLSSMMRRQLDDFHANREPVAVLFSSEGGIYGRYGYGPASFGARYVIDKRLANLLGESANTGQDLEAPAGSVRLVERAQAAEAFPVIFAAYVLKRPGEVDRPNREWLDVLGPVLSPGDGHRFFVCYERAGSIDGYAIYRIGGLDPLDHWRRGVFLEELCALSDIAYRSLWRYLLGLDLTEELRTSGRPIDEPVRYLFEDPRQFRTASVADRTWVRLVEVAAALALRRYDEEGRLVIEVEDGFCPWNEGRFGLSVGGDGLAVVERVEVPADLVFPSHALASIYLGGVSLAAMAQAGLARELKSGSLRLAGRMFRSDQPPFCTSDF